MPGKGALMATGAGPADPAAQAKPHDGRLQVSLSLSILSRRPSSRFMCQLKSSVRLLPLAACTAAAESAGSPAQPPLASRHASSTLTAR